MKNVINGGLWLPVRIVEEQDPERILSENPMYVRPRQCIFTSSAEDRDRACFNPIKQFQSKFPDLKYESILLSSCLAEGFPRAGISTSDASLYIRLLNVIRLDPINSALFVLGIQDKKTYDH